MLDDLRLSAEDKRDGAALLVLRLGLAWFIFVWDNALLYRAAALGKIPRSLRDQRAWVSDQPERRD